jgi:hypothetical protein
VNKLDINSEEFDVICKNVLSDFFSHEKNILFLTGPQDNSIRVRENLIHRRDLDTDPH